MSISSAPASTAARTSSSFTSSGRPARGERGGDGGHLHAGAGEGLDRGLDQVAVDADGGDGRAGRVGGVGAAALGAQGPHLARRVLALERGEVDHADGEVEGERLGRGLDRPGGERRGPGLDADLVDAGQPVEEPAQRGGGGDGVGQLLRGR